VPPAAQLSGIEHGPGRSSAAFGALWNDETDHMFHFGCDHGACPSATFRRSLYIDDQLYTVSDGELRATHMGQWNTTLVLPLHTRETLAAQGSCTLGGDALPWERVAASAPDIYCGDEYYSRPCGAGDRQLGTYQCDSNGWMSFNHLLHSARNCCGNSTCACETVYDTCRIWF
jgi:hypothetical protein